MLRIALPSLLALTFAFAGHVRWIPQDSGVSVRFRGVSAVNDRVAWASGEHGTVVRTTDGGGHWLPVPITAAATLDVRDIDAVDDRTAYALTIGPGDASRIYKTTDGGQEWTEQFVNREPKAFFDGMAFWDADHGLAMSDSVDGAFLIVTTANGGRTWERVPAGALPPALPGEGGFAASGTNVAVHGDSLAWVATGAGPTARVLRTGDRGRTWAVSATPLPSGPSSGIFSIAFRDPHHGIIVGGDYKREAEVTNNVAVTDDGGVTWRPVTGTGLSGFRSVVAFVDASRPTYAIAVGPAGADESDDGGVTWRPFDAPPGMHAFAPSPRAGTGWAVGERGQIVRLASKR